MCTVTAVASARFLPLHDVTTALWPAPDSCCLPSRCPCASFIYFPFVGRSVLVTSHHGVRLVVLARSEVGLLGAVGR